MSWWWWGSWGGGERGCFFLFFSLFRSRAQAIGLWGGVWPGLANGKGVGWAAERVTGAHLQPVGCRPEELWGCARMG